MSEFTFALVIVFLLVYMIKKIKSETNKNDKNLKKYKVGIKLAFYLQQFANASILSDNLYEIILKGNE